MQFLKPILTIVLFLHEQLLTSYRITGQTLKNMLISSQCFKKGRMLYPGKHPFHNI